MDDKEVFAALAAALKPMNTTKDIADNCGIKEGTLAYWRSAGIGPKFVKVGRIVMYPKEQMIAYFAQHLYQCTAEYEEEVGARWLTTTAVSTPRGLTHGKKRRTNDRHPQNLRRSDIQGI